MAGDAERRAWICLASVIGVGEEIFSTLIAEFGSARGVLHTALDGGLRRWSAQRWRSEGKAGLPARVLHGIERVARDPGERLRRIDELRLWTLTPFDADYPARLRDLDPVPSVIFGLGERAALGARRAVAVVGTRRPTPSGRTLAARLVVRLVECRATVISGLAVGIDGAAHAATVEREGVSVGVIGGGHSQPGARAHAPLRRRLIETGGAVISEYHPDVGPTRGTYPKRNRIIAALADAVVVIEAPRRSGALITARHGLELGRHVLVAPGRVGDWSVAGSLALLRETPARPLVGLDELVADLGYLEPDAQATATDGPRSRGPAMTMLSAAERAVAERICVSPAGLDLLVADTGLPPAVVSSAVTLLLVRGWLQPMGPAYLPAGPLLG